MMRRVDMEGALRGRYGATIFSDVITARLYDALHRDARERVRRMMENDYQGSTEIARADIAGMPDVAHATIRISDCVARSEVTFGPDLPEASRTTVDGYDMRIPGELPETLKSTVARSDLGRLTGHALLKGCHVVRLSQEGGMTVLRHDSLPVHIYDADAGAPDADQRHGIAA